MTQDSSFLYELEGTEEETKWQTTTIRRHGRLVSDNANQIRELVKPPNARGERIILDFSDLEYLDSSGLGALVGLKVAAINHGLRKLEVENLTPRVRELLSVTNLKAPFAK